MWAPGGKDEGGGSTRVPSTEEDCGGGGGGGGAQMAGGGCIPLLLSLSAAGSSSAGQRQGGPAEAMDDLVGETILVFLTVADAVRAAATCKAAAAAQQDGADFRRIAGMRFKHVGLLLDRLPQFRSLRHLDLNGHDLGPEGSKRLAHAMAALASVPAAGGPTTASGVAVVQGDEDGEPLMKPRLRRLELAGCRVGAAGCNHLARALEIGAGRALTVLDLSANQLMDTAPISLARALATGGSPSLVELDLSNNYISAEGAEEISRALRAGGCKGLQRLNLSSNDLAADGLRVLLAAFLAGACPKLEDLGLASNCLGVQGAVELGGALQRGFGRNLKRLSLASNGLGSLGLQILMDATAAAAAATRQRDNGLLPRALPFRYFHIDPVLLAQRAQQRQQLHAFLSPHLNPRATGGSSSRSKRPAQPAPPSPLANLQEMNLFLNEIQDAGAAGLAMGLAQGLLPSLQELDVSANRLGPAGVVGIVSALEALRRRSGLGSLPPTRPPSAPVAAGAVDGVEAKARAKRAAAAAGAPWVNLAYNLLPEERGAVSHAMVQGVLL